MVAGLRNNEARRRVSGYTQPLVFGQGIMSQSRNTVRIIGGEYRRRLLPFPDAQGLRPTPDRVRETLFNWLGQQLYGKSCLDLFAGSGALGFEAASREARRVVMVEKSRVVAESESQSAIIVREGDRRSAAGSLGVSESLPRAFRCRLRRSAIRFRLAGAGAAVVASDAERGWLVYVEARRWPEALPGWEVLKQAKAGQVHYGLLRRAAEPS